MKRDGSEGGVNYTGQWGFGTDDDSTNGFKYKVADPADFSLSAPPSKLTANGFFWLADEAAEEGKRKIKESSVEIKFRPVEGKEGKRWTVSGGGENEFGKFTLVGEFRFKTKENKLYLEKKYEEEVRLGGGGGGAESDSEDDDMSAGGDGKYDDELAGLQDDANLSVEELRRQAYAGAEAEAESTTATATTTTTTTATTATTSEEPPKKKKKVEKVEESDDDDEGF